MNIVNHSEIIWEYQDVHKSINVLLNNLMSGYWMDYTNVGGGNTILGSSTGLNPDSPYYYEILKIFTDCLTDYLEKNNIYIPMSNLDVMPIEDRDWLEQKYFTIRRYDPGSIMFAHEDYGVPLRPKYTAILYFNENYEGGEISFPNDNVSIKPKSGSVIIFPSIKMHEVRLVVSGQRYLTSCYLYDKDENAKI